MKGRGNGNRHGRTAHGGGQAPYRVFRTANDGHGHGQGGKVKLCANGIDYGSDQQRTEKALSHGAKGINSIALQGNFNVFALTKILKSVQG